MQLAQTDIDVNLPRVRGFRVLRSTQSVHIESERVLATRVRYVQIDMFEKRPLLRLDRRPSIVTLGRHDDDDDVS